MSQDCCVPKKKDKIIALVDKGTNSEDKQSGKARL
jgi:hypothetical protein